MAACDAGYEFRNICFRIVRAHKGSFSSTLQSMIENAGEQALEVLLFLSYGTEDGTIAQAKFIHHNMPPSSPVGLIQAIRFVRKLSRAHRLLVLQYKTRKDSFCRLHTPQKESKFSNFVSAFRTLMRSSCTRI